MTNIAQFRYYGENNINNYPEGFGETWPTIIMLQQKYTDIKKVIIQTMPGTRINFFSNSDNQKPDMIIGSTGIFELDLTQNDLKFYGLHIYENSLELIKNNSYFIMTIIYTKKGEES